MAGIKCKGSTSTVHIQLNMGALTFHLLILAFVCSTVISQNVPINPVASEGGNIDISVPVIEGATQVHDELHASAESVKEQNFPLAVVDNVSNSTGLNTTLHDEINASLADDEERVLSGGEVKVRKKRTFCRRCFPTMSYGYGGGGGCCGQCGQCGGGYARPIRIKVVKFVRPSYGYGGYGGGGGCCYNPCNVCGR